MKRRAPHTGLLFPELATGPRMEKEPRRWASSTSGGIRMRPFGYSLRMIAETASNFCSNCPISFSANVWQSE